MTYAFLFDLCLSGARCSLASSFESIDSELFQAQQAASSFCHSLQAANFFEAHGSYNIARNSFRIRTYRSVDSRELKTL
jgi:hypothetical protein